jgi:outer membrane protein
MARLQIVLVVAGIALIILLYSLPKVLVADKDKTIEPSGPVAEGNRSGAGGSVHGNLTNVASAQKIEKLRSRLNGSVSKEIELAVLDSIGHIYMEDNQFDSAAASFVRMSEIVPEKENFAEAGEAYYQAFTFATDAEKSALMGERARFYFEKALEKDPSDLEIKSKIAMTYLSTENPMQGIQILKEVLKIDPENRSAIFNLGVLSVQSGQYDKAIDRFEKLVKLQPDHVQARFYLGVCYKETGKKDKAREQFLEVKRIEKDPEVQANVDQYLKDLE